MFEECCYGRPREETPRPAFVSAFSTTLQACVGSEASARLNKCCVVLSEYQCVAHSFSSLVKEQSPTYPIEKSLVQVGCRDKCWRGDVCRIGTALLGRLGASIWIQGEITHGSPQPCTSIGCFATAPARRATPSTATGQRQGLSIRMSSTGIGFPNIPSSPSTMQGIMIL